MIPPLIAAALPPLPPVINAGVSIVIRIHVLWRWRQEAEEIWQNTPSYAVGHCLEQVLSWHPALYQSSLPLAKIVLIGRRFLDLQNHYSELIATYETLIKTVRLQKKFTIDDRLSERQACDKMFSGPGSRQLRVWMIKAGGSAHDACRLTVKLLADIFELSQRCILFAESLTWNGQTIEKESIRKVFINLRIISENHDKIVVNQDKIASQLEKLDPFFQKEFGITLAPLMKEYGITPKSAQDAANTYGLTSELVKTVSEEVGHVFLNAGKHVVNIGSATLFKRPVFVDPYRFCPGPDVTWPERMDLRRLTLKKPPRRFKP